MVLKLQVKFCTFVYRILSNGFPLDVYHKTICLTMLDVFNTGVTSPNVSNFSTYSSRIHIVIYDFTVAGNFYLQYSRTDYLKDPFSSIAAKIWNSIPNSDRALPKYKFKDIL